MKETFELNGLKFKAELVPDEDMGPPWVEHDGHGVVVELSPDSSSEAVDEDLYRPLMGNFYYDVNASAKLAEEDHWGISEEMRLKFVEQYKRGPELSELSKIAVVADYEFLRGWATDEWSWVGVVVTLLDVDGNKTHEESSLWGIESNNDEYHDMVAQEKARGIAADVGDAQLIPARPSQFRIRSGA